MVTSPHTFFNMTFNNIPTDRIIHGSIDLVNGSTIAVPSDTIDDAPIDLVVAMNRYFSGTVDLHTEATGATVVLGDMSDRNKKWLKHYKNCMECYKFSMLFGGYYEGRRVDTEEEFEIVKGEFVQHFNEKHRDLARKEKKIKKYVSKDENIKDISNIVYLTQEQHRLLMMDESLNQFWAESGEDISRDVFGRSTFRELSYEERRHARLAERQQRSRNLNAMDRQTRFREEMSRGEQ